MVSWNSWVSWVTTPTASRSAWPRTRRRSTPPMRTTPSVGSYSRDTRWVSVVLPAPDGPTRATSCPGRAVNETSLSTWVSSACSGCGTSSRDASEDSAPG